MFAPLIAAVLLAAPAGFTESPVLDARAAVIAGKTVHVYCAVDGTTWQTYTAGLPTPPPGVTAPAGYTPLIGGDETYLSPDTCTPLLWKTRKKAPDLLRRLGASIDIVTHESMHMRGDADEGVAECDAIRAVPGEIVRWGYPRKTTAYKQVLAGAWRLHRSLPPEYRSAC